MARYERVLARLAVGVWRRERRARYGRLVPRSGPLRREAGHCGEVPVTAAD